MMMMINIICIAAFRKQSSQRALTVEQRQETQGDSSTE